MLFSLLINVKMPTVVGILTFMSRKNFRSGSEVTNLFSSSTQLCIKLSKMLIRIKISRTSAFFSGSDKPIMLFFLLINVKMPTAVGILIFMSRKKIHAQLS